LFFLSWDVGGIDDLTVDFAPGTFSIPITKDPQPPAPNVYHTPLNDGALWFCFIFARYYWVEFFNLLQAR
jgi:hypothetical protein